MKLLSINGNSIFQALWKMNWVEILNKLVKYENISTTIENDNNKEYKLIVFVYIELSCNTCKI